MRILLATDFSETASRAQGRAVELARALGAELVLLHVTTDELPPSSASFSEVTEAWYVAEDGRKWATDMLRSRVAAIVKEGVAARARVVTGDPADEIVRAATNEGADFIVMGIPGRDGGDGRRQGGVADRVIHGAPCPVMTVRDTGEG